VRLQFHQACYELGDRKWRALLSEHNAAVRRELERFRRREVKTVSDGFVDLTLLVGEGSHSSTE
jgi:hypothetical protein